MSLQKRCKNLLEISPTILPDKYFHAETDAKIFHSYLNYSRYIENLVANRTSKQLKLVEKKYKMLYGGDLKKDIESKIRRADIWKNVVLERFNGRWEYQASILRRAEESKRGESVTIEQKLINVICTKRNDEIKKIKDAYKYMYGRDLINDIKRKTSGYIGRILGSILLTNRHTKADIKLAQTEAKQLYYARINKDGSIDEEVITNIFSSGHSFEHLRKIFLYYKELSGRSIVWAFEKLKSDHLKYACLTSFQYIEDPITYYSEVIYNSLRGANENGNNLDRVKNVIVSRCETDLKSVKERFQKLHGTSLEKELKEISTWDNGLSVLTACATDCSKIYPPIWQQLKEIMDAVESFLPVLEFGLSKIIALFAVHVSFQSSFNAEHLTFTDENRVDGRNLSRDTAAAIANFAVMRDGRPVRIRWKIHEKNDEMWIGFTMDKSYVTHHRGYWCSSGIISYYGGREAYIGSKEYPAIEKPILGGGKRDSGYGSLQIPGVAQHVLQPYSKGNEIELEVCLRTEGNGDWISLYHNKEAQLTKWNIDNCTKDIVKLFPFAVIDRSVDDVQFELVM